MMKHIIIFVALAALFASCEKSNCGCQEKYGSLATDTEYQIRYLRIDNAIDTIMFRGPKGTKFSVNIKDGGYAMFFKRPEGEYTMLRAAVLDIKDIKEMSLTLKDSVDTTPVPIDSLKK